MLTGVGRRATASLLHCVCFVAGTAVAVAVAIAALPVIALTALLWRWTQR